MRTNALQRVALNLEGHFTARVVAELTDGVHLVVLDSGAQCRVSLATHLTSIRVDQKVLVWLDGVGDGLVLAAWPAPGKAQAITFDSATETLRIEASSLQLCGVSKVELTCGDAHISLSLDGRVHLDGQEVLSSAVGRNRIEGGTIDLN